MKATISEAKVETKTTTSTKFGIKEILLGLFVNGKSLADEINAAIDAAYKEK